MSINKNLNIFLIAVCTILTGCATSRSEIQLAKPSSHPTNVALSTGPVVVIRSVKDERIFEQRPHNPSTPSLGFEGADNAPVALKSRAIGRKRNAYGKALGDVVLQGDQTVESVVRENLVSAFEQAGYRVGNNAENEPSALFVDVHIKKFWAWINMGFWSLTQSADIATDIDLSGSGTPATISVHTEEGRQFVTDEDWMAIVGKALADYRAQVSTKLPATQHVAKK
jgi:uncharacterized lipoprotein YajG